MADNTTLREDVAALTKTIRDLQAEVSALRAEQTRPACHECHCAHVCVQHVWQIPAAAPVPWYQPTWTVTYGTTMGNVQTSATSNACAGAATTYNYALPAEN